MILGKFRQSLKKRGIIGTAKRIGLYSWDIFRWYLDGHFDRSHKVNTSGKTPLDNLHIDSPDLSDATWYEPVPVLAFNKLMKELKIRYEDYAFIDFGSGKSRAMFLASDFPFKKVKGIEFSPMLHAACMQNILSYRSRRQRCYDIEPINGDIVDFRMPPVSSVLFFL
jgi:hypothetical protein